MVMFKPLSQALHEQYVGLQEIAAQQPDARAMADLLYDFYSAAKDLEDQIQELQTPIETTKEACLDLCQTFWRAFKLAGNATEPLDTEKLEHWVFETLDEVEDLREKHKSLTQLLHQMQSLAEKFQQPATASHLHAAKALVEP